MLRPNLAVADRSMNDFLRRKSLPGKVIHRLPGTSYRRQDELPLWVKTSALRLEPTMRARQVAWVRRASDAGWLAVVLMPAGSANGQSRVTMQLWLEANMITTDLTTGP